MSKAKRAKSSSLSIKLLIVATLVISSVGVFLKFKPEITMTIASLTGSKINGYEASELVDGTFTQGTTKYVPIILKRTLERVSKTDVENDFKNAGLVIKKNGIPNQIVNGSRIETSNNGTYTALIYGDVNCDGQVDVLDALEIAQSILSQKELTGIKRIAANVDEEKKDVIDINDAHRIVQFTLGRKGIIDSLPDSDIKKDNTPPKLTLNGEETVNVKIGEKYTDAGVTATDEVDFAVASRVNVTGLDAIDTSRPGTYTIRYNVSDKKGNKAKEITRTVNVINYVKSIKIDTMPTKKDYASGETIDLTGLKVITQLAYVDNDRYKNYDITDQINYSPKIATANNKEGKKENKKITITYKEKDEKGYEELSAYIDITVTPLRPIISVDGGLGPVYIALGGTFTPPAVSASYTSLDGITYPINEIGISVNGTSCTEAELSTLVDTNTVGKYTITYAATANDITTEEVKEINVIDVVDSLSVNFKPNKLTYIDGETIDLTGLVLTASMKSGDTKTIDLAHLSDYEHITSDIVTAAYISANKQDITFTYTNDHEILAGMTAKTITLQKELTVKDKIKTLETVGSQKTGFEIYADNEEALVLQVQSPVDQEDAIGGDKNSRVNGNLDVEILKVVETNGTKTTEPLPADVKSVWWTENVEGQEGVVKIHCSVSEPGNYEISVTPVSNYGGDRGYTKSKEFTVTKKAAPTYLELSEFKHENERAKTGDELYADVTYWRSYSNTHMEPQVINKVVETTGIKNTGYDILNAVKVYNEVKGEYLTQGQYSVELCKIVGGKYVPIPSGNDEVVQAIKIVINDDLEEKVGINDKCTDGTNIRVTLTTKEGASNNANNGKLHIYNKSKYELVINNNYKDMTLYEPEAISAANKDPNCKYVDAVNDKYGLYYTLLEVEKFQDQYGELILTAEMLENGDITIEHYAQNGDIPSGLIDEAIGLSNGKVLQTGNSPIKYIGIAIRKNLEMTLMNYATLNKGIIKATMHGQEAVNISNSISIKTGPVQTLKVNTEMSDIEKNCYNQILIATVKSGDLFGNTGKVTILEKGDIGIQVTGKRIVSGVPQDIDELVTEAGAWNETNSIGHFGFITEETEVPGEVRLLFWADTEGYYTIKPYLLSKGAPVGSDTAIQIYITHRTEVTRIVFNGGREPTVKADGTNNSFPLKFYHTISDISVPANDREHEVSLAKGVTVEQVVPSEDWEVNLRSGNMILPDGTGVNYYDAINIVIKKLGNISTDEALQFRIYVDKGTAKERSLLVSFGVEAPVISDIEIGTVYGDESITVYDEIPQKIVQEGPIVNPSDNTRTYYLKDGTVLYEEIEEDWKTIYTLVPVQSEEMDLILGNCFGIDKDNMEGKTIALVDPDSDRTNAILTAFPVALNPSSKTVKVVENTNEAMTHIAISVIPGDQVDAADPDLLMNVSVYVKLIDPSTNEANVQLRKTIKIYPPKSEIVSSDDEEIGTYTMPKANPELLNTMPKNASGISDKNNSNEMDESEATTTPKPSETPQETIKPTVSPSPTVEPTDEPEETTKPTIEPTVSPDMEPTVTPTEPETPAQDSEPTSGDENE